MNVLPGPRREDIGFIGRGHLRMMGVVIMMVTFVLPKIVVRPNTWVWTPGIFVIVSIF